MKLVVTLGDGFNEPNFQPVSPTIDRVLTHLEKLAPGA